MEPLGWSDLPKLASMLAPLWVFDLDLRRIAWANEAALDLWAADTIAELLARDFSDMSAAAVTRFRSALAEVAAGKPQREQWTLYPRGKPTTVIVGYRGLILADGRLAALLEAKASASLDPTTLRAVEALHHTHVRVLLFTTSGAVVMQNASALQTFGVLDKVGDAFARIFPDDAEAARARATVEAGEVYSAELPLVAAEGPRWHGLDARRVNDPVTGGSLVLVNARDIEDRRAAESTTARALASQKRFLAAMSHEIRTPLNAVIGFVDLLRGADLGERERRFADNASLSAQHLLALVSEVLDVSKIEADQLELHLEEIDLEDVVLEAVIMASGRIRPAVSLSYLLADLDCFVRGDPLRIRQIIVNLLGNAAKFTEEGFVRVVLDAPEVLGDGRIAVTVAVEDSGLGIPDEKISQLFRPFKQAHGAEHGGTGLGLYLSRALARLMGGDIEVQSTVGLGSRFTVRLVLDRGQPRGVPAALAGKRVLALTQEPELHRLLEDRFQDSGTTVARPASASAADALRALLGPERLDAVLLDFETFPAPGLLAAGIRAARGDAPIVGLTSSAEGEARDAPVDAWLAKPFSFHRLAKLLAELVAARRGSTAAAEPTLSGMKILLVEDVEMNVSLMREAFRDWFGLEFALAVDGLDAVEQVRGGAFHLVFMDMQLPRLDGVQATRRIRALGITVPIVALTANALSEDIDRARAAGMDGYLPKPVRRADLERELRRHAPGAPRPREAPPPPQPMATSPSRRLPAVGSVRSSIRPEAAPPEMPRMPAQPLTERARRHLEGAFGPKRVDRLLTLAASGVRDKLEELKRARAERSPSGMGAALHGLRGVLLNCGLDDLGERVATLEHTARAGAEPDAGSLDGLCAELAGFG